MLRCARHDTTLPLGGGPDGKAPVYVPKGTTVFSLTFHIHHDRDIWGDEADAFRPERWTQRNKGRSEIILFLSGPGICPAQQQILLQATYLLLRIVRESEWVENRDEVEKYVELQRMAIESRRVVKIALGPEREVRRRRRRQKGYRTDRGNAIAFDEYHEPDYETTCHLIERLSRKLVKCAP